MTNNEIMDLIRGADSEEIRDSKVLIPYVKPRGLCNELLFFIKPEITLAGTRAVREVLKLAQEKFERHAVEISGLSILGNEYLKKFSLIEAHYGVINMAAKKGLEALTAAPRLKFREIFGKDIESVLFLGGFEFLEKYPDYSADTLNDLWESGQREKLGAGLYCEKHLIDEKTFYILNGFNPFQLSFFTRPGRYIIVFTVNSKTDWPVLRNRMIGETNPYKADGNSLRAGILRIKDDIGVDINPGRNGVHLSAGPVEALAEIIRFCSALPEKTLDSEEVYTGTRMRELGFDKAAIMKCIANEQITFRGERRNIFDLTEDKNLEEMAFLRDRVM